MFDVLSTGASSLKAQRIRMDTIASNVANMHTTEDVNGQKVPFRRRMVIFQEGQSAANGQPGVHVKEIRQDMTPFQERYDPTHPHADKTTGMVKMPNIDLATETVNMMSASRAYEASLTMMETAKAMYNASLRLIA